MPWSSYFWTLTILLSTLWDLQWEKPPKPDPGETLARQYCSSCHQFPDPEILNKKSWGYLLTDMGFRLGIIDYSYLDGYPPLALFHMTTRQQILRQGGLIPDQPMLTNDEWQAIRQYFLEKAPSQPVPQPDKQQVDPNLTGFKIRIPDYQPREAVITLTRIDEIQNRLLIGNQNQQSLTILDKNLKEIGTYPGYDLLVDARIEGDNLLLLSIGDLMGQHIGVSNGYLLLSKGNLDQIDQWGKVVEGLHRPADMEFADIDGDGVSELIFCNFGDVTGNVSIYRKLDQHYMFLKELINVPGAIKSQAHDFNKDGLTDIAVLMGDARENISIFMNLGNHQFERKIVVETHPAYGHTYFELQDFNGDGHMDILTANGDTDADPFNTLKNYHGIRIYLNNQNNSFTLFYFYPMYGAHFAKAADFDMDGDLDIAASAFFPDFASERPEQFTFLENTGDLNFRPYTHPETYEGRWMTLDIGDYDGDGDIDIALGAGYLPLGMSIEYREKLQHLRTHGKALLIFENTVR